MILQACAMTGRKVGKLSRNNGRKRVSKQGYFQYVCGPKGKITLEKQWSRISQPYALQTTRKDILVSFSQTL